MYDNTNAMMHHDGMDYGDDDEVDGKMLYLMFGCGQQCPSKGGGEEEDKKILCRYPSLQLLSLLVRGGS